MNVLYSGLARALALVGLVNPSSTRDRIHPVKLTAALSFLIACALLTAADAPTAATFIAHDKVAGALANGGPMLTASDLIVQGGHPEKGGQVEVHENATDVS